MIERDWDGKQHEQRRSSRLPVRGVASLQWEGNRARRYALDNVSLGGALMMGAPQPAVGSEVTVELRVPGMRSKSVRGQVVRASYEPDERSGFAVAFGDGPDDIEEWVQDLSVRVLQSEARPAVLIVARSRAMRETLGASLESIGWHVTLAATPLEALLALEREREEVRWVIILDQLTQTSGVELLQHVARDYPRVRRLLVCRPDTYRYAQQAVRDGLADAALLQPVQKQRLGSIVGPCTDEGHRPLRDPSLP